MEGDEARRVLGFAPNSLPTPSEVTTKSNLLLNGPNFKLLKQLTKRRYGSLILTYFQPMKSLRQSAGGRGDVLNSAEYSRVVRTGVPRASGGRKNHPLIKVPFILIILGTAALGGLNAARAYKKQKEDYPSHNPFLP